MVREKEKEEDKKEYAFMFGALTTDDGDQESILHLHVPGHLKDMYFDAITESKEKTPSNADAIGISIPGIMIELDESKKKMFMQGNTVLEHTEEDNKTN